MLYIISVKEEGCSNGSVYGFYDNKELADLAVKELEKNNTNNTIIYSFEFELNTSLISSSKSVTSSSSSSISKLVLKTISSSKSVTSSSSNSSFQINYKLSIKRVIFLLFIIYLYNKK